MDQFLPGQTGGQHFLARMIDHSLTYGPGAMRALFEDVEGPQKAVDLGAGSGRDLGLIKSVHPECKTIAIEAGKEYAKGLEGLVDEVHLLNIEMDRLPFENESVDVVIANQVLEHTKELFWIIHEMARSVKVGGHLVIGVPNVLSFHNRILGLVGVHPTQHKSFSAHVRPFSKSDFVKFFGHCAPGVFELTGFKGSQFYPFPPGIANLMSKVAPTLAFSIFFKFTKIAPYGDSIVTYPARAMLETNFYAGDYNVSQYNDEKT